MKGKATMATSASSTKSTSRPKTTSAAGSDASQVREGVTKTRHGAIGIARQSAERALDVPVGAALTLRDRVTEAVEPWTSTETRERGLQSLRAQVTKELSRYERRGGQVRRKTRQRVRSTRTRVEREVRARRRGVVDAVRQNRTRVEKRVTDLV